MRRFMAIFAVVAVLVFGSAFAAFACVVCDERVDGNAAISVFTNHGDYNTGGIAFGAANGEFSATGHNFAFGDADAEGRALGGNFKMHDFAFSFSSSDVRSGADAYGNCFSDAKISGFAGQANWAKVGDGLNGAFGENYTGGFYKGRSDRWGFVGLFGGASADGFTSVYNFSTPISRQSGGITQGDSNAWIHGLCDPSVFGSGSFMARSYLSSENRIGLALGMGNATYSANSPRYASGSLTILVSTSVNLLPNGVNASSHVSSMSSTRSR